ncbi:MAG: glycosyltransferase family 39 protein [Alphaproteobacteria bacterium]|nr:glycosyltransferase family 39 protein [Alphaproteobacteria bacterium]
MLPLARAWQAALNPEEFFVTVLRRARDDIAVGASAPSGPLSSGAPAWLAGWRPYALLALICLALGLPGMASLSPFDRDESRFMQATRQMLETGDVIAIRFQGEARNKKPVGIYWLQAASVAAFSDAASTARWPYRIPSLLGALAAVLATFAAGAALFDRRTAFLGAAILGSSLLLIVEAHLAKTDACLLGATTIALAALARIYMADRGAPGAGRGTALVFWAALGAGILLKGPITPMVAGLTIAALAWADRDRRWLKRLAPLLGVPLMLAIVLPWVVAIAATTGGQFFADAVGGDLVPKLMGGQESHGAPPGLYLLLVAITFWPASLFVLPTLVHGWANRRRPAILFTLAWLVPTWIVFELVPTKLPHYVLPAYPALALLTAAAVASGTEILRPRWAWTKYVWGGGVVLFGGALIAVPLVLGTGFNPAAVPAAAALWTGAYLVWRSQRDGDVWRSAWAALISAGVAVAIAFAFVVPQLDTLWVSRRVAAALERLGPAEAPPVSVGFHEPSLVFMLGTGTVLADTAADAARHLGERAGAVAIVEANARPAFEAAAAERGLAVTALDRIEGINYSNGRRVTLALYRAARR